MGPRLIIVHRFIDTEFMKTSNTPPDLQSVVALVVGLLLVLVANY